MSAAAHLPGTAPSDMVPISMCVISSISQAKSQNPRSGERSGERIGRGHERSGRSARIQSLDCLG
jgi:hypothetical protein